MLDSPVLRAALISMGIVGVAAVLMWQLGPSHSIGFMSLRVVNDTDHAVKIQPCWDIRCWDSHGLSDTVVPPGEARRVSSEWEDDMSHPISVAVLQPRAEMPQWDGCLVNTFPPHRKVGVFRVSNEQPCPTSGGGGGAG